jgi:hypothetical protein
MRLGTCFPGRSPLHCMTLLHDTLYNIPFNHLAIKRCILGRYCVPSVDDDTKKGEVSPFALHIICFGFPGRNWTQTPNMELLHMSLLVNWRSPLVRRCLKEPPKAHLLFHFVYNAFYIPLILHGTARRRKFPRHRALFLSNRILCRLLFVCFFLRLDPQPYLWYWRLSSPKALSWRFPS